MKSMIKPLCLAGMLAASPVALSDTILGIYTGGGIWKPDLSGSVGDVGQPGADLKDLNLDDQEGEYFFVALEHPVPLLPNIRLQHTDLSMSEAGQLSSSLVLDGVTYSAQEDVHSDFDFTHTDATLYYELLDNWVNLDLGLTARKFDGHVSLRGEDSGSAYRELDETIPMLYAKAQFNLPLSGFYVGLGGNYASYEGSKVSDFQASAGFMSDGLVLDFGVELGIRNFGIELDDVSELDADMDIDGPFAQIYLHF